MPFGSQERLFSYLNLKLAAIGAPTEESVADSDFLKIAQPLLRNHFQKDLLLEGRLCPVDSRIQSFLDSYLDGKAAKLPSRTFVLDRPGLARALSLPAAGNHFTSQYLDSFRIPQGILHNPRSDRRTTQGLFHIVEGGLPVPYDKKEVPKIAFARLLEAAMKPTAELLTLPFTSAQSAQGKMFVSLLLRPLVVPATAKDPAKTMEIRFFAPASLVSNLDFVEGIFGNGGDPDLPENDAALDVMHWTGHTGCVILAPHINGLKKKDLGLPHISEATERQKKDGMCWADDAELYNDGKAFKLACRDARGVMVTLIADNYFGYCKKEVKTQISYAANLFGLAEEEHAGGAIAFPSYVLGNEFLGDRTVRLKPAKFGRAMELLGDTASLYDQGYAVDKKFPTIIYVPENAEFNVREGHVKWLHNDAEQKLSLRPENIYVLPSGYQIRLEKQLNGTAWRLVGTVAHGTLCHKPSTVSGGGKSEISKSIAGNLLHGPIFVHAYQSDMDAVAEILKRDFSNIFKQQKAGERTRRPILSPDRSLGSVIKLLTPSPEYRDSHNEWVRKLPQTIRQLVCTVKRYYRPEWGDNWREHFTVDRINGYLGHELKFMDQRLVGNYLRVGYDPDGSWRVYKLRPDFRPAEKLQVEDDITASVVLPRASLDGIDTKYLNPSLKLVENCERLLFQRPDDAIHPGVDVQAEADLSSPGTFISNFEPLTPVEARALVDHVVQFDRFSQPVKTLLNDFVAKPDTGYVVSSAHPRIVDGKPTKNPRYLQKRPDLVEPRAKHIAEMAARLDREVPVGEPIYFPVNAVLAGRRNNPPDVKLGIPPLAVYNPIHYQELPELFMDLISSLTGKSPSTTGFGSEGALTKGPFNALWPIVDLNNALVASILTGYAVFTTAAGHVGPQYRVDHDISMLIPEIWCRMRVEEREPAFLIDNGFLEKLEDYDYEGRRVLASRLGYRITGLFTERFCGRMFETPDKIFTTEMLCPELQDEHTYAQGIDAIVEAQTAVARSYFEDGSAKGACPPLAALLQIMAYGTCDGMTAEDPKFRAMFTREALLESDWYKERLKSKQASDIALWTRHVKAKGGPETETQLKRVSAPEYLDELFGTIGRDPFWAQ